MSKRTLIAEFNLNFLELYLKKIFRHPSLKLDASFECLILSPESLWYKDTKRFRWQLILVGAKPLELFKAQQRAFSIWIIF
jgi:hypothetical protein